MGRSEDPSPSPGRYRTQAGTGRPTSSQRAATWRMRRPPLRGTMLAEPQLGPSMSPDPPPSPRAPRFFVSSGPEGTFAMHEDDVHHALHVHRLKVGDPLWGLDGAGQALWMRVIRTSRRHIDLEPDPSILPQRQVAPGDKGSPLPYIELAVSLPKPKRMEEWLQRLTQLGVARLQPILCRYTPPENREGHEKRSAKWQRFVREAMKQSGRLWPLEIAAPLPLDDWWQRHGGQAVLMHHEAGPTWWSLLQERREPAAGQDLKPAPKPDLDHQPIRIAIGPEGGFSPEERAGRPTARLSGYVLRTETAAELAAGCALQALERSLGGFPPG